MMTMLEKLLLLALKHMAAYHRCMSIIRHGDMEVEKVVTPSGVTGYIATSATGVAIDAMIVKLEARIKAHSAGFLKVDANGELVATSPGDSARLGPINKRP